MAPPPAAVVTPTARSTPSAVDTAPFLLPVHQKDCPRARRSIRCRRLGFLPFLLLVLWLPRLTCCLSTPSPPRTFSSNLSLVENLLLNSRLEKISEAVAQKFERQLGPLLDEERDNRQVDVTLVFPGAGGPDELSLQLEESLRQTPMLPRDAKRSDRAVVATFDWSEHRGSILTAAYDGECVGETVARCLWEMAGRGNNGGKNKSLRSVHCVGISVGAFAAHGLATGLSRLCGKEDDAPYLRLTLLDPFTSRGIFGPSYGPNEFGLGADYAVQYLNTDDPVPTTNTPLPHCVCYDVTTAKVREEFVLPEGESMHCWPVAFFARYGIQLERDQLIQRQKGNGMVQHGVDGGLERGTVLTLD